MRTSARLALVVTLAGCGPAPRPPPPSPPSPVPYAGHLETGALVRGIVEVIDEGSLGVVLRASHGGRVRAERVTFPAARAFVPPPGGVMVIFRVLGASALHGADDASGSHDWFSTFSCELLAVEATEAEAVDAARACVTREGYDARDFLLDQPRASGPSGRGGWIVRFPDRLLPRAIVAIPNGIELEISAAKLCKVRQQR